MEPQKIALNYLPVAELLKKSDLHTKLSKEVTLFAKQTASVACPVACEVTNLKHIFDSSF